VLGNKYLTFKPNAEEIKELLIDCDLCGLVIDVRFAGPFCTRNMKLYKFYSIHGNVHQIVKCTLYALNKQKSVVLFFSVFLNCVKISQEIYVEKCVYCVGARI